MKFSTKMINIFGGMLQVRMPIDQVAVIGDLQSAANSGKALDVEIKVHRNKRSRNANSYCWTLAELIAQKLGRTSSQDVYRHAIREAGVKEYLALAESSFERFKRDWEGKGLGCQVQRLRELNTMQGFITVCVYYGSSSYDTREMSVLIDYLVEEAKQLGCDVISESERQLLLDEWSRKDD